MTTHPVGDAALDQIFRTARSGGAWSNEPVTETEMRAIYELAKFGPTSANSSPARFVWVATPEGKARLMPHIGAVNIDKVAAAPLTVIIGHDLAFAERLPELFPQAPTAKNWFANPAFAEVTAFRNGTLQGAYLLMAARALGFVTNAMSGFDNAGVDAEFFAGTTVKSNFICSIGHADQSGLYPRNPRLTFDEAGWVA
jgi:3-hydroxypropanoate dehydrogenase